MQILSVSKRRPLRSRAIVTAIAATFIAAPAQAAPADEARFREIYKELVETNTTLSAGSCTAASEKMGAWLRKAGYTDKDFQVIVPENFPKQGNLVARIPGSNPKLPALLLLAHIDVVEANRTDWQRDPFKLVEEDGYFYARGAVDDKAMASSFVDAFVRYREEGFKPKRTIKLALTCGEETDSHFNGVTYLLEKYPDTLKAGWAVNEGGKGFLDENGKPKSFGVEAGQKAYQDYTLVATSPGGHSARPTGENAIVRLSAALVRIGEYNFPARITEPSKLFFGKSAALFAEPLSSDMKVIGAGSADEAAIKRISAANPLWNAFLRTTCVPTLTKGGHAPNAVPQRDEANVNCRILPGETVEDTRQKLVAVANDARVTITLADKPGPLSPAPPLTAKVLDPVEKIVAELWPGVPVVPGLSSGATDGRFLNAAGIPTYGISGMFNDPDGNGIHGLNERIRIKSLMDGRTFLYRLAKAYGAQ